MKKINYFCLFIITLGIFAACSASNSPGKAAQKYAEYIKEGKYDKFAENIVFDKGVTQEEARKQKEMLITLMKEKGESSINEKGGIKEIEIVSEDLSANGDSAKVVLKQTFGNGMSENTNYEMLKQDGKWKMVIRK